MALSNLRPRTALALALGCGAVDPSCECLNWRQVYSSQMAVCGEAVELFATMGRMAMMPSEIEELYEWNRVVPVCDDFYKQLDTNLCANIGHYPPTETQWFAGTWCYVSNECQDISGGRRLADNPRPWMEKVKDALGLQASRKPGNVSWKICTPSTEMVKQDQQLRDLSLEEVFTLSERLELDLGITAKYSLANSWVFWGDVEMYWRTGSFQALPDVIRRAMKQNTSIIVDVTPGGQGDLKVIRGKEVHSLDRIPTMRCGPTKYCRRSEVAAGELYIGEACDAVAT
eukprot:CAMPEP_0171101216 /NCGR_PEP_ID=MMETSP0766_2-20121228/54287_1 /TAXON_ID=439317 /ORGANISM="Gambierdiscus australes, Strain CAWD 149" /LENGTH=285 /DNA_ID=CAMNT_0011561201 /DNA_START=43 /DNA_END=897 /DNA_ORIENTATION=+